MRKRVIMCQWFCDKIDAVPDFVDDVWFSDEAHFLLSDHVNSKNNIFWGSTPPEHCLQRPLHSVKCTAWVAISKHGIIGPFWLEDDNERSVTINTERYVQVLGKFWTALGQGRGSSGSSSGSSRMVPPPNPQTNHWHGYRSISLTDWSAAGVTRSGRRIHRTWTHQIFICGDTFKDRVYSNNPQTIRDLKAAIRAIPRDECRRVIKNFAHRIQMCLQRWGAHLDHILRARVKQIVFVVRTWNFWDVCCTGLT